MHRDLRGPGQTPGPLRFWGFRARGGGLAPRGFAFAPRRRLASDMADAPASAPDPLIVACIALGSNLASRVGDSSATLDAAVERLGRIAGVRVLARSSWIQTAPVGVSEQPEFLNGACVVETTLRPEVLLERLMEVEREFGRERRDAERWGPRTLDLDLLLYGTMCVQAQGLVVPHPRMHERGFVLEPLVQIAPHALIPTLGATVEEALRALRDGETGATS